MRPLPRLLAGVGAVLACAVAAASPALAAPTPALQIANAFPDGGTPQFTTDGGAAPLRTTRTVTYWSSAFTDPTNGVTYPFTMVGTDPRGLGSTTVKAELVPLSFHFVAGNQRVSVLDFPGYTARAVDVTMDASGRDVAQTLASPVFQRFRYDADLGGDTGQNGDVFMRAQFGKIGTPYHVELAPTVLPTVSIEVPQNQGVAVVNARGVLVGRIDEGWLGGRLQNLLQQLHVDPTTLAIFVTHNVLLYANNDYLACCGLGFHGADSATNGNGKQAVQTYAYAAYVTPKTFVGFGDPAHGLADVHALSHEVAEWLADPFLTNGVQPWFAPTAPQYGCTSLLEPGDPLVGVYTPLAGNTDPGAQGLWHPQDDAFLNWFARNGQPASLSPWDGRYTFNGPRTVALGGGYGGFASPAGGC
jgi:hypothetical protein